MAGPRTPTPFLTGFVPDPCPSVYGRPVGITLMQDGTMLVSDDGARMIWRIEAARSRPASAAVRDGYSGDSPLMPPQSRGCFSTNSRTLLILTAAACISLGCRMKPYQAGGGWLKKVHGTYNPWRDYRAAPGKSPSSNRRAQAESRGDFARSRIARVGEIDVYPEYSGVAQAAILRLCLPGNAGSLRPRARSI